MVVDAKNRKMGYTSCVYMEGAAAFRAFWCVLIYFEAYFEVNVMFEPSPQLRSPGQIAGAFKLAPPLPRRSVTVKSQASPSNPLAALARRRHLSPASCSASSRCQPCAPLARLKKYFQSFRANPFNQHTSAGSSMSARSTWRSLGVDFTPSEARSGEVEGGEVDLGLLRSPVPG